MTIRNALQQRATVTRSSASYSGGSPTYIWTVISVRTPVLLSRDSSEFDPTWTPSQRTEADSRGTLFALPTADIQPGDRVHITRPAMPTAFEVLPDPSEVTTLHDVSHSEHKVRSVS